jgi:hypothetical protein
MKLFDNVMEEDDETGGNSMPAFMADMSREDMRQMMELAQNLLPGKMNGAQS